MEVDNPQVFPGHVVHFHDYWSVPIVGYRLECGGYRLECG